MEEDIIECKVAGSNLSEKSNNEAGRKWRRGWPYRGEGSNRSILATTMSHKWHPSKAEKPILHIIYTSQQT